MENPKFRVTLNGKSGKALKPYEIQVASADLIQWDLYRHRHSLPEMQEVSNLWSARVCYTASQREGKIEERMPWEAFSSQVLSIEFLQADEVDPTPAAAEQSS